jgi:hypothetical protein
MTGVAASREVSGEEAAEGAVACNTKSPRNTDLTNVNHQEINSHKINKEN